MSWSIHTIGKRRNVRRDVENAKGYGDTSQFEAARKLILDEIDAYPETVPALQIIASGHHDDHTRQLHIEIKPVWLSPDDEDAAASE